jgi:hypothetical protein
MSFSLPHDVREWIRHVFHTTNDRISTKLDRIPTVHETSLDLTFIESLSNFSSPFKTISDWLVRIDTHYLGGGRHFGQWEVADIGIIITLRQAGRFQLAKIGLLQSKRLYPDEQDFDEDEPIDYLRGFGRLFEPNDPFIAMSQPRQFNFSENSKYKAILKGEKQLRTIRKYEKYFKIPVYYLLYNPRQIPWKSIVPITAKKHRKNPLRVGSRVLPASRLERLLKGKTKGYSPTYFDLASHSGRPFTSKKFRAGWRLEQFVVDSMLRCTAGYRAKSEDDPGLRTVFSRRDAPIAASIGITIDAPPNAKILDLKEC